MKDTSAKKNSLVRIGADEIPDSTEEDLARLRRAMTRARVTSDMPEVNTIGTRPRRDASGKLVQEPLGLIRRAILSALGRRRMTRYRLWRKANTLHPTLSQSAVYEYLRGQRDIGVTSVEALMKAAGVRVNATTPRPQRPKTPKAAQATSESARRKASTKPLGPPKERAPRPPDVRKQTRKAIGSGSR